jgi:hypothetical protein
MDTRTPEELAGGGELVEIEHPEVDKHGFVPREGLEAWTAEGWEAVSAEAPKAKATPKEHHTAPKAGDTPSS